MICISLKAKIVLREEKKINTLPNWHIIGPHISNILHSKWPNYGNKTIVHSVRTAVLSFKLPLSYDKLDTVASNSDYIKSSRFNHSAKFFPHKILLQRKICFFSPLLRFLGLTAFSAALIYTLHNKEILQDSRELTSGRFGYCFILAWVCVPLLLCSGIMYIHLRKKEWPGKREKNPPNNSCKSTQAKRNRLSPCVSKCCIVV